MGRIRRKEMTNNNSNRQSGGNWYKGRTVYKIKCTVCGQEFDSWRPQGDGERYCSDACRGRKQYEYVKEKTEQVTHKYVCQGCNSTFTTVVPRPEDKMCFCSMRCRQSWHSRNRKSKGAACKLPVSKYDNPESLSVRGA
jgi:hypothetical protein